MVTAIWVSDDRTSAQPTRSRPGGGAGSRTMTKIGIANSANRTPAMRKIGSGVSVMPRASRVTALRSVPT